MKWQQQQQQKFKIATVNSIKLNSVCPWMEYSNCSQTCQVPCRVIRKTVASSVRLCMCVCVYWITWWVVLICMCRTGSLSDSQITIYKTLCMSKSFMCISAKACDSALRNWEASVKCKCICRSKAIWQWLWCHFTMLYFFFAVNGLEWLSEKQSRAENDVQLVCKIVLAFFVWPITITIHRIDTDVIHKLFTPKSCTKWLEFKIEIEIEMAYTQRKANQFFLKPNNHQKNDNLFSFTWNWNLCYVFILMFRIILVWCVIVS